MWKADEAKKRLEKKLKNYYKATQLERKK